MDKKLLFTPLVLNPERLSYSGDFSKGEHRKFVLKFALVQALIATALWIFFFIRVVQPILTDIKEYASEVLENANFSEISVNKDELGIDITPGIFTHTVMQDESNRLTVVLTQEAKMNPFYWDDRLKEGKVIKVEGFALMKDEIVVKWKDSLKSYKYSDLPIKPEGKATKSDLNDWFINVFSKESYTRLLIVSSIAVLLVSYVLGVLVHLLFSAVVGFLASVLMLRIDKYYFPSMKRATLVYIGYVYIFAIIILCRMLIPSINYGWGSKPVYELLALCLSVFLVWKSYESSQENPKVKKKKSEKK